jgi:hypothetical protein
VKLQPQSAVEIDPARHNHPIHSPGFPCMRVPSADNAGVRCRWRLAPVGPQEPRAAASASCGTPRRAGPPTDYRHKPRPWSTIRPFSPMHFLSGPPMHFYSGVDTLPLSHHNQPRDPTAHYGASASAQNNGTARYLTPTGC